MNEQIPSREGRSFPTPLPNDETARTDDTQADHLQKRMRRQAQIMAVIAILVLGITLSVPFLIHFFKISL